MYKCTDSRTPIKLRQSLIFPFSFLFTKDVMLSSGIWAIHDGDFARDMDPFQFALV